MSNKNYSPKKNVSFNSEIDLLWLVLNFPDWPEGYAKVDVKGKGKDRKAIWHVPYGVGTYDEGQYLRFRDRLKNIPNLSQKPDWADSYCQLSQNNGIWMNDTIYQHIDSDSVYNFADNYQFKNDVNSSRIYILDVKPDWNKKPDWEEVWVEDLIGNSSCWCHETVDGWCSEDNGYSATLFKKSEENKTYKVHYPPEFKPDWDNKPDWAEVWIRYFSPSGYNLDGWYKSEESFWVNKDTGLGFHKNREMVDGIIIFHPLIKKNDWVGEFPPLKTVCKKISNNKLESGNVLILGYDGDYIVYRYLDSHKKNAIVYKKNAIFVNDQTDKIVYFIINKS